MRIYKNIELTNAGITFKLSDFCHGEMVHNGMVYVGNNDDRDMAKLFHNWVESGDCFDGMDDYIS